VFQNKSSLPFLADERQKEKRTSITFQKDDFCKQLVLAVGIPSLLRACLYLTYIYLHTNLYKSSAYCLP
jgi:hypothetical protein